MATPFVKSNVQAIKVKQVQDELKQMETKAVDLNSSNGNPKYWDGKINVLGANTNLKYKTVRVVFMREGSFCMFIKLLRNL